MLKKNDVDTLDLHILKSIIKLSYVGPRTGVQMGGIKWRALFSIKNSLV